MKKRADGRWRKTKTIDGIRVAFYSTAETEKQAIKDIENQMLAYSAKMYNRKHNFKILADKMLELQSQSISYNTILLQLPCIKYF